jgi:hypothetical protein
MEIGAKMKPRPICVLMIVDSKTAERYCKKILLMAIDEVNLAVIKYPGE